QEHQLEVLAMLANVEKQYAERNQLSNREDRIYRRLRSDDQCAFRIFRSLARMSGGEFYLSCEQLRVRMRLTHDDHAKKLIDGFCRRGIIKLTKKGESSKRREKWFRRSSDRLQASEYKWLL